jgi:aspartate racemase
MSWESTTLYYQWINLEIAQICGGLSSAKMLIHSFDFSEIAELQRRGDWHTLGSMLADSARRLEDGGADCIVIATNAMHCVADRVADAVAVPLIHVVDATVQAIKSRGAAKVGWLGTQSIMEQHFFRSQLEDAQIETLLPDPQDRAFVHGVIFKELCHGECKQSSRDEFVRICGRLKSRGAQGVILGCSEVSLLLGPDDVDVPLFDTTHLHAHAAAIFALAPSPLHPARLN